ncbi:ABC transporter permease [bacterium]|nr:ABC transporter permease [bacterium]
MFSDEEHHSHRLHYTLLPLTYPHIGIQSIVMLHSLKELIKARELLLNLALKELKVRYKSAVLGFLWAILHPLLLMGIFALIFGVFMKLKIPKYPAYLLTGLIPWFFFSSSLSIATNSIVDNYNLVKKVYFPRKVLPLSIIISNFINFLLSLLVLFIFLYLFFGISMTNRLFYLPLIVLLQLVFISGFCFITASLNVYYRDVKYIMEILLTLWFYATPIFYTLDMVPRWLIPLFYLNPMSSLITLYRQILVYGSGPDPIHLITTLIISLAILKIGITISDKYEYVFADFV